METYPGLPHRQQLAAVIDGVRYVNDSKATNPEAAAKALSSYNEIYWIAGGRAKEGPLDVIHPFLPHVKRAYLIGESADHLAAQLADRIDVELCGDLALGDGARRRGCRRSRCRDSAVARVRVLRSVCEF